MYSVLFVCTANICRSPMAMGLMRALTAGEADEWRIESAGTWSLEDEPAAARTQQVLDERGIDIRDHRARSVSRELLRRFQLILTMESGQKEAILIEFPETAGRIYLLSEIVGETHDIRDPIRGTLADFRDTAAEIESLLARGFDRIRALAQAPEAAGTGDASPG